MDSDEEPNSSLVVLGSLGEHVSEAWRRMSKALRTQAVLDREVLNSSVSAGDMLRYPHCNSPLSSVVRALHS